LSCLVSSLTQLTITTHQLQQKATRFRSLCQEQLKCRAFLSYLFSLCSQSSYCTCYLSKHFDKRWDNNLILIMIMSCLQISRKQVLKPLLKVLCCCLRLSSDDLVSSKNVLQLIPFYACKATGFNFYLWLFSLSTYLTIYSHFYQSYREKICGMKSNHSRKKSMSLFLRWLHFLNRNLGCMNVNIHWENSLRIKLHNSLKARTLTALWLDSIPMTFW